MAPNMAQITATLGISREPCLSEYSQKSDTSSYEVIWSQYMNAWALTQNLPKSAKYISAGFVLMKLNLQTACAEYLHSRYKLKKKEMSTKFSACSIWCEAPFRMWR